MRSMRLALLLLLLLPSTAAARDVDVQLDRIDLAP
jgi:hypothetical protein